MVFISKANSGQKYPLHSMMAPSSSTSKWVVRAPFQALPQSSYYPLIQTTPNHIKIIGNPLPRIYTCPSARFSILKIKATLDEDQITSTTPVLDPNVQEEQPTSKEVLLAPEVEESVKVLKNAAKTRKVPPNDILSAFSVIEKAKLDPSKFLETLGGTESPGRTWMLIFTAQKKLEGGKYFPITAVQRFDAAGRRIENGVFLGPIGFLTFEGRFSWKKRILAFIFERIRIKVGPFNPFEFSFKGKDDREPSNQDPFFIWFYIDEEIAVARGRSGGTAFWVRCQRAGNS